MAKNTSLKASPQITARPLEEYFNALDIPPFDLIQLTPSPDYFTNQTHADFYVAMIDALKQGQVDQALKVLETIAAQFPRDFEALNIRACFLIRAKKFDEAKKILRDAEQIKRNDPKILNNLGIIYYRLYSLTQAVEYYKQALKYAPTLAQIHFNIGLVYDQIGEHMNAYNAYTQSLRYESTKEAASRLGNLLKRGDKMTEALSVLEANYNKNPNYIPAIVFLSSALSVSTDKDRARDLAIKAVLTDPKHPYALMLFSDLFENKYFEAYVEEAEEATLITLNSSATSSDALRTVWLSLLKCAPHSSDLRDIFAITDYDAFCDFMSLKDRTTLYTPFFLSGIKNCFISDGDLERALCFWRKFLLCGHTRNTLELSNLDREFLAYLSENMFFNEFVFEEDTQEKVILDQIADETDMNINNVLLFGCYRPLSDLKNAVALLSEPFISAPLIAPLIHIHILEPNQEKEIVKTIKSFDVIKDGVSQKVREQYEENPYPRWKNISIFGNYKERPEKMRARQDVQILIAGCGTGQQVISHARVHQNFHFTAIDLSKASLAYAIRKCTDYGLDAVDFYQGDILNVSNLEKKFDHIFCTGVLHHMKDPDTGMAALVGILKPGGTMRLAVYSEIARRVIVKGQHFIKENHYPSTPEGIKRFRKDMYALPENHELSSLRLMMDFFTLSNCRDLLFHVQEHRFTVETLDAYLKRHGLVFKGFSVSADVLNTFKNDFPNQNPDILLNWAAFEEKYPDTFYGMYQFTAEKPKH